MKVWLAKTAMGAIDEEVQIFSHKPTTLEVIQGLFEIYPKYWEEDTAEEVARNPEEYEVYINIVESIAARRNEKDPG